MNNKINVAECAARLSSADNILIITHVSPDGDAVGSSAALCAALRSIGKSAFVLEDQGFSPRLKGFLNGMFANDGFVPDFICAVDAASDSRFADAAKEYSVKTDLCIDHHPSNTLYAAETFLDGTAAATTELIYILTTQMGIPLTKEIALPLYLGLITDTGCFKYSSVTPRTFHIAADMLAAGVDAYPLNREFFELQSMPRLALQSMIIDHMETSYGGEVAISSLSMEEIASTNAGEDDTESLSSTLRTVRGVELGLLLRETDNNKWRLSARSSPGIDASALCLRLGGGGHPTASGATIYGEREHALSILRQTVLDQFGEDRGYLQKTPEEHL